MLSVKRKALRASVSIAFATLLLCVQSSAALAVATAPALGTAQSFAVLGGSTVTNTGNSIVRGDLGLSPGSAITGFPPGIVVPPGTIHVGDAVALGAQSDATTAYNNLAGQACDFGPFGPTDLAGQTLVPGVYCYSSSVQNSGAVTLNGTASDVWVFRIGSSLSAGPASSISGSGSKCNVFWQVGSSATLDTTSVFNGTIIAAQSISINNGATLNGRALARAGAVSLINDTIDATGCAGVAPPGGVGLFLSFSPSSIPAGGVSTLSIAFTNAGLTPAVSTALFTLNLPSGLSIANQPMLLTTCAGGGLSATAGGSTLNALAGTVIPAGTATAPGFCTISVNVTSGGGGSFQTVIPIGALQTTGGSSTVAPTALLSVAPPVAPPAVSIPIPTLPDWGLLLLAMMLAIGGWFGLRRHSRP